MNIIRDNEELAYRILAGDNLINLEIVTSINNNQINRNSIYIGLPPEIKTLSSWMNAILEEINNMLNKKIKYATTSGINIKQMQQNKSFRGEIDIPWNPRFNSFSLTEALKTRTITYDYYTYNEKIKHIEPTVKHTEQVKISDKLYDILDSLTLFIPEEFIPEEFIPSNSNDSNNADYSLIINNCPYNDNTYILLTVHPATAQYEIVNKIDIINKTSKSKKHDRCHKNIDIVVIPASEHRSLIDQSHISMTNKYMITSLINQ